MTKRAAIIVLDGLGIGPAPDTAAYGDEGSDTLGNVARAVGGLNRDVELRDSEILQFTIGTEVAREDG